MTKETLIPNTQSSIVVSPLGIWNWSLFRHYDLGIRHSPYRSLIIGHFLLAGHLSAAPVFHLPTANHALFERGQDERFLVGTVGKPWTTGGFGCVRTDGWQMH